MGLVSMHDYANTMNIEWDLEDYKKMLPKLEKIVASPKTLRNKQNMRDC